MNLFLAQNQNQNANGECPPVNQDIQCIHSYNHCPTHGEKCEEALYEGGKAKYCCPGPCGNECKALIFK